MLILVRPSIQDGSTSTERRSSTTTHGWLWFLLQFFGTRIRKVAFVGCHPGGRQGSSSWFRRHGVLESREESSFVYHDAKEWRNLYSRDECRCNNKRMLRLVWVWNVDGSVVPGMHLLLLLLLLVVVVVVVVVAPLFELFRIESVSSLDNLPDHDKRMSGVW